MHAGDLILMGPPGSGKGTQARALAEREGFVHLATGDLFRDNLRRGTALGKLAEKHMAKGEYVPDDVTVGIVRERLREIGGRPVVFDGFPRTLPQAEALDILMAEEGRTLRRVVLIEVPPEEIVRRISGRGEGRSDDSPQVARRRLAVYQEQTRPVVERYELAGMLCRVDGVGTVAAVSERVREAVGA